MKNLSKIVVLAFVFLLFATVFATANAQGPLNSMEILEEQRGNIDRINQQRQAQIREFQPTDENSNMMRGITEEGNEEVMNRTPERTRNNLQEKREEVEEKINQRLEGAGERRKQLNQGTQNRVSGLVMSIFNRFSQVNERFTNAINRIEERAQFFSENFGIDLDQTNSSIENLRNSVEELNTEIIASEELLMERVDTEIAPEEAREIIEQLKNSVKNTQQEIKDLIQILREEILEETEINNATSSQN